MAGLFDNSSKKNAKAQQAAIDAQAALSAAEFAKRNTQQATTTKDINTLRDQGFDASSDLRRQDFKEGMDSDASGFAKTGAIADAATGKIGGANSDNTATNKNAFIQLGTATNAERARQKGFQGEANTAVDSLTPQLTVPGFLGRVGANAAPAQQLVDATATGGPAGSPVSSDNPVFAAEMMKRLFEGRGRGVAGARGIAGTNAYGAAANEGDRLVGDEAGTLNNIKARSAISEGALAPEMHAADTRKENAAKDLTSMLDLIQNEKEKNTGRVTDTKAAQDKARGAINASLADAINNLYSGKIGAQSDFLTAFLNASQAYENASAGLTGQKVNLTQTSPSLFSQALQQAQAAAIQSAAKV